MDSAQTRFVPKNERLDFGQSANPYILKTLISAIEAPNGVRTPLLKRLYYLLIKFTSNPNGTGAYGGADVKFNLELEINQLGVTVACEDICRLSSVLFRELSIRFRQLVTAFQDFSTSKTLGESTLHNDMWAATEILNLLLRCCMGILSMPMLQQHLLLKNGKVLLAILRQLTSLSLIEENEGNNSTFKRSVSHESTDNQNDYTASFIEFVASLCSMKLSVSCHPFVSSILEVFVDELTLSAQLRSYFKLIDSVTSANGRFVNPSSHEDTGIVMEVLYSHFSLSFSDEQAFEKFVDRLFLLNRDKSRVPELSLRTAISLLLNPIMLSAPKYLLSHLISLVSEAIEILKPMLGFMDCYVTAFEKSVILYTKHMSGLLVNAPPTGDRVPFGDSSVRHVDFQPSIESYVGSAARQHVDNLNIKLDNLWHSHLCDMFSCRISDLIISSIAYINANQCVLDMSWRDDILMILNSVILRAAADVSNMLMHTKDESPRDIYLLASILKLMSSSLLSVNWCLRHSTNLDSLKTSKNFSLCKEYGVIVGIIRCFGEFNRSLPIQKDLCKTMETQASMHMEPRMMLFHFAGLLSLSLSSGLSFLVKGCILIIMSLTNLFVLEESNLDALRSIINSQLASISSELPACSLEAVVVPKSMAVASKFHRLHKLHSRRYLASDNIAGTRSGKVGGRSTGGVDTDNMEDSGGTEDEMTCNGNIFLKCVVGRKEKLSDFDDVVDFVECKQGKDYADWLKSRCRYRRWRSKKMAGYNKWRKEMNWKLKN